MGRMGIRRRTLLQAGAFAAVPGLGGRRHPTVFVAGDSTAATYAIADHPRAGWGQALHVFLHDHVRVVNEALSGASSKSFYDLGRLDRILAAIRPGDTLLIRSSYDRWGTLGPETTKDYFLWVNGLEDNTHFQAHGAIEVARLVVAEGRAIPGRDRRALRRPGFPDEVLTWPPTRPAES